ncbi:MAG: hypothetical protein ASARMPREDX12_004348 [Alectoria sarmentosa]|nr:MAG: hypothetical protein ASARMPREDX12_004348 [Alectoria sarmentosa]
MAPVSASSLHIALHTSSVYHDQRLQVLFAALAHVIHPICVTLSLWPSLRILVLVRIQRLQDAHRASSSLARINKMVVELPKDFQAQYNKLIFSEHQYRNSRTGARSTRTQIDHDVFEGLPVRHWRKRSFNVNAAPEKDNIDPLGTGDTRWPELPMPRDAHMYSPMSEALLRAARMGQVKKPATPLMDDEKEPGEDDDADGDLDMGFVAKRWAVVPKDMEGPEPEFLAKRRKGLPSVYTGATGPLGTTAQMRKTKIRKVDMEGNSYIWEVLVLEGQAVDGEIVEEETTPTQAPVPGTVVEGLGVVNAEGVVIAGDQATPAVNRRRPPPPKRKAKGPGRGRKKKVAFISGIEGATTANGSSAVLNGSNAGANDGKGAKMEHVVPDGDTEMGDENVLQEGEDGSEEGSEGEEGEDGDREEGELSPSPTPAKSPAEPPTIIVDDIKVEPTEIAHDTKPSPSRVSLSSTAEPTREDSSDPMLLDQDDDEPTGHSFSESAATPIAPRIPPMVDVAAPVATEVSEETMPTPESIPGLSEAVVEEPYAASIAEPQTEAQMMSMTTPPPDTTLQPLSEPEPEPEELSVAEEITEILPEQPTESPAELLTGPVIEPAIDIPAEHAADRIALTTAEAVAEQIQGTPADLTDEAVPEPRIDDLEVVMTESIAASSKGDAPEPSTNTMATPTTKVMTNPRWGPEMGFPSEPQMEVTDPIEECEPVAAQPMAEQSVAEQPVAGFPLAEQSMAEQPVAGLPTAEQSMAEQFMAEQSFAEQSTVEQPVAELPLAERSMAEQPMAEQPFAEQPFTEQSSAEQPVGELPLAEQYMVEHSIAEQPLAEQPVIEQPMTEPWARPTTEPFPEAISPERRFSYTRVTTSPQAPTPSPPTPIENTFGLKAPYLSPKAPTMSPPTPIERSMSSSPDIPLADQHFRLPPQIDAAQEADQALAPDIHRIPDADRVLAEAAPNVDPRVNAQIPVEHDPLDGLVESRIAEESEGSTQHFTDGEEDLLGSLERSLGKHSGRS